MFPKISHTKEITGAIADSLNLVYLNTFPRPNVELSMRCIYEPSFNLSRPKLSYDRLLGRTSGELGTRRISQISNKFSPERG